MKKIAFAVGALILVFVLFHVSLWGIKTRTLKNHLQEIMAKEANHISAASISSSFLPLSQKITLTNLVVKDEKGEVLAQNIEIYPTAFSTAYVVKFPQAVLVKSKGLEHKIEFSSDSKYTISQSSKEHNLLLKYNGSGYKLIDNSTQKLAFELQLQEGQTEIDFGDDLTYRSKSMASKLLDENNHVLMSKGPSDIEIFLGRQGDVITGRFNINIKDLEVFAQKKLEPAPQKVAQTYEEFVAQHSGNSALEPSLYEDFNSGKVGLILVGSLTMKKNNNTAAQAQIYPPLPKKYDWSDISLELQNFEFADEQYKILLNGRVDASLQPYPKAFGAVTLQVENLDNIVNSIILNRGKKYYMNRGLLPEVEIQKFNEEVNMYVRIIKDLATKNSKTTATRLVFDIKKNPEMPEMKINETTFAEILFQLMMMKQAMSVNEQNAAPQPGFPPHQMQDFSTFVPSAQFIPPSPNQAIPNQMVMPAPPRQ